MLEGVGRIVNDCQRRFEAIFAESRKHHLSVRVAAELMTRAFEGRFELLKIVDFTVENQNVAPISRAHWLMPLATQVLNCQSTMHQADSGLRIGPDALIVGTPMTECCSHVQRQF